MGFRLENKLRPLRIRFEICHDNDDYDFRSELVSLMISSVKELRSAAVVALEEHNADSFRRAVHKSKSTLILLDDAELFDAIERYKAGLSGITTDEGRLITLSNILHTIEDICESVVESLHEECAQLKARANNQVK